jgi:beta-fructofuranosidase
LLTWTKHTANPVIAAPPPGLEVIGFRDPFVWREGDGWACVIGTGIAAVGGAILLYRSRDLLRWDYVGQLCVADAGVSGSLWTGSMWECPQFFPLGDKHVLIFSAWDAGKTHHTVYAVGDYTGDRFTPHAMRRLDLGSAFYAPATMLDDRGRRLMWGWLREARQKAAVVAAGWSGVQSLPRVLTLGEDNTLRMRLALEIEALRGAHRRWENMTVDEADAPVVLPQVEGDALELRIVYDVRQSTARTFGLRMRRSPGDAEYTDVVFDRVAGRLTVDREHASLAATSYRGVDGGPVELAGADTLTLRIFLDRSVVEIYDLR